MEKVPYLFILEGIVIVHEANRCRPYVDFDIYNVLWIVAMARLYMQNIVEDKIQAGSQNSEEDADIPHKFPFSRCSCISRDADVS